MIGLISMTVDMSWLESPKRGEKTMFYRSGGAKMKKIVCVFLLIVALVLSLSACSHNQIPVTDLSILPTGDISGDITPDKDMSEVIVCVVAKDSTGKVNFEGTIQLSETFSKDVKTTFSFDIFDTRMWSDATFSYNPFGNMYKSFLEDNVSCKLMYEGKEISSFTIDTTQIDLEKAFSDEETESADETESLGREYDEDGNLISINGIPIATDAGNNNYEGIGDTSIYNPIESFDIENPSIP